MSDEVDPSIRSEIVRCARDRRARVSEFTGQEPVIWKPTEVVNPESGIPFTAITAWHFIADQVEAGCKITPVVLRKPPGEIGYELDLPGADGCPRIYVKLSIKRGRVIGRSFHNSSR